MSKISEQCSSMRFLQQVLFLLSTSWPGLADKIQDLKELRNQISLKHEEANVAASDARVILAKEWLESSPAGQDIFNLLDRGAHVSTKTPNSTTKLTILLAICHSHMRLFAVLPTVFNIYPLCQLSSRPADC